MLVKYKEHFRRLNMKYMWRILVLSLIPGSIIMVREILTLVGSINLLGEKNHMKESVTASLEVGEVVHNLQNEREIMALYVSIQNKTEVESVLQSSYTLTDYALATLTYWVPHDSLTKFSNKRSFRESLIDFRNRSNELTYKDVTRQYADDVNVFIDWMVDALKKEKNSDLWSELVAFHMLVNGKECIGVELSIGAYFFTHGGLDLESLLWYKANYDLGEAFMHISETYSSVATDVKITYVDPVLEQQLREMQKKILRNTTEIYSTEDGLIWVENMTTYINQLNDVTRAMAKYITMKTDEEIFKYKLDVLVDITILGVTISVAALVSFTIYKISKNIERVKECLQEKTNHLEKEQKRTESLLSQLVPTKIAKRMRTNIVEPEFFKAVTVMFADICNFDMLINRSTADELLELVNDVFDVYEKLLERFNVSKLGTTGHMLMVASGLHQQHSKRHVEEIASLALDLLDRIQQIHVKQAFGERVKLRIGICTGPVVAGVINGKLPRYCLFGETVTDAKLMLDTCLPLHIQMGEAAYLDLSVNKQFLTKERDDLSKRNGAAQKKTYWLYGNRNNTLMQIDLDLNDTNV